jgi:rod shape-determining protein MreC
LARLREDASAEMARTLRRILLAGLALVALVLFALWRADSPRVEALRLQVADRARPLLELSAAPFAKAVALIEDWERFATLHGQNRDLRREVERLRGWREAAQQLERENARLRALNNVQLSPRLAYTTAEILADPRSPFGRSVLVSVGSLDGVVDGSAAVDGNGLVGRIVGVGEDVARLLLLTDFSSRVPVKVLPGGQRGVLTGDGGQAPRLDFVADAADLTLGARVVTSGDDGVFPPDIPVGVLAGAGERVLRVSLAADYQLLDFVRILRWQRDTPRELTPDLVGSSADPSRPEAEPANPDAAAPGGEAPAITGALASPVREPGPQTPRPAARPGG